MTTHQDHFEYDVHVQLTQDVVLKSLYHSANTWSHIYTSFYNYILAKYSQPEIL